MKAHQGSSLFSYRTHRQQQQQQLKIERTLFLSLIRRVRPSARSPVDVGIKKKKKERRILCGCISECREERAGSLCSISGLSVLQWAEKKARLPHQQLAKKYLPVCRQSVEEKVKLVDALSTCRHYCFARYGFQSVEERDCGGTKHTHCCEEKPRLIFLSFLRGLLTTACVRLNPVGICFRPRHSVNEKWDTPKKEVRNCAGMQK